MSRLIFWILAIYIIYNFLTKFLFPVVAAGSKIRSAMRDQVNNNQQQQGFGSPVQPNAPKQAPQPEGEYIDFEEVK